jgi:hypothetical protein
MAVANVAKSNKQHSLSWHPLPSQAHLTVPGSMCVASFTLLTVTSALRRHTGQAQTAF